MKYSSPKTKKIVVISFIVIVLGALVAGASIWLHIHNVRLAQKQSGQVANVTPPPSPAPTQDTPPTDHTPTTKTEAGTQPTSDSTAPLAPTGNFVSNHRPGQNGTDTSMQSACNTTPEATCDIIFTSQAGVKKNLGGKIANNDGAAIWTWDVRGANLGPGVWTITATSTLNGITTSTTDAIKLEVQ